MIDESLRNSSPLKPRSTFPIHVLRGRDSLDRPCYWFIMCPHDRIKRMLKSHDNKQTDISQIGIIVASGLGVTLSDYLRKKLKSEYDCDADALFRAAQSL